MSCTYILNPDDLHAVFGKDHKERIAMTTKAQLNVAFANLAGVGVGLGDYLNMHAEAHNASSTSTAAVAVVTLGGTARAGDTPWIKVGDNTAQVASRLADGFATGTVTVGGTLQVDDVLHVDVDGELVAYSVAVGDSTHDLAAESLRLMMLANPDISDHYSVVRTGPALAITSLRAGPSGQVSLEVSVGGAGATTTLTRSAATLLGGSSGTPLPALATMLAAAVNASQAMSDDVTAVASGLEITLTAKLKGTGFNSKTLTSGVIGVGATITATAEAATFGAATAGTGANDLPLLR
jgi:phage tail sheath gpL-like